MAHRTAGSSNAPDVTPGRPTGRTGASLSVQLEWDAAPVEVVGEIVTLDGPDGERLAEQQARVLWEVTQWQAQNRSKPGQRHAA